MTLRNAPVRQKTQGEETDDDLHPLTRQPENRAPRIGIAGYFNGKELASGLQRGRKG
jgi:hypothetical protein